MTSITVNYPQVNSSYSSLKRNVNEVLQETVKLTTAGIDDYQPGSLYTASTYTWSEACLGKGPCKVQDAIIEQQVDLDTPNEHVVLRDVGSNADTLKFDIPAKDSFWRLASGLDKKPLVTMLGLFDASLFFSGFNGKITDKTAELGSTINDAFKAAGISLHVMDRVTIDVADDGSLILGGIKDKATLAKIETALKDNPELGKKLTRLAAENELFRMFNGPKANQADIAAFSKSAQDGIGKFDALKRTLLTGYLEDNGIDLSELTFADGRVSGDSSGVLQILNEEMPGLEQEIAALFDPARVKTESVADPKLAAKLAETQTEKSPMFVFQNGKLLSQNVNSDQENDMRMQDILTKFNVAHPKSTKEDPYKLSRAIREWNDANADTPERQIQDFKMVVDENGNMRITAMNALSGGKDAKSREGAGAASRVLQSWLDSSFKAGIASVADGLFETHQAQHGDVDEYAHQAVLQYEKGQMSYAMRSENADNAALADLETKTAKVGAEFSQFFKNAFGAVHEGLSWTQAVGNGFSIEIDGEGKLSLAMGTLANAPALRRIVNQTMGTLNERLASDDPFGEEGESTPMNSDVRGILSGLVDIQKDLARIHDPEKRAAAIFIQ